MVSSVILSVVSVKPAMPHPLFAPRLADRARGRHGGAVSLTSEVEGQSASEQIGIMDILSISGGMEKIRLRCNKRLLGQGL